MFDNMNLNDMFGEIQKKAKEMQNESENKIFTAKSGGGMVSISINGSNEVIDLDIDESLLQDKESMQILLISAINDAIKMVEEDRKRQAMNIMGGFNPFAGNQS
jgi:hypothetical protein